MRKNKEFEFRIFEKMVFLSWAAKGTIWHTTRFEKEPTCSRIDHLLAFDRVYCRGTREYYWKINLGRLQVFIMRDD